MNSFAGNKDFAMPFQVLQQRPNKMDCLTAFTDGLTNYLEVSDHFRHLEFLSNK